MDWTAQTQAIAAVASVIVTVFGFIFVVSQINLVKRTIQSDSYGRLSEQSYGIITFIAERPYLYDYFYASKKLEADDEHRVEVLCACEMIANYSDLVACILEDLNPKTRERWTKFIADSYANSPALREFTYTHKLWYSDELLRITQ